MFGLGGDQNRNTLNGIAFSGGDIPRDGATRSSLGMSPWDVSRGGFSGAQFGLRTQAGSNFSSRGVSNLLNGPALQWTDRTGRSTGAEFNSLSVGAATTGPVAMDRAFYSAGYQFDRRASAVENLLTADAIALQAAGIAPDSVTRLRRLLGGAGVPLTAPGLPTSRLTSKGSFLGALDFAPPSSTSGQAFNLTAAANFTRANAVMSRVTALPTDDVGGTNWFGSLQGRHTNYAGIGILTETTVGVSRASNVTDPYSALPSGGVRVSSALDDGSTAVSRLTFGGSPTQQQDTRSTALSALNQLSWFSTDNEHRFKLTSELRYEAFEQRFTSNQYGTFSYNSLADFEAGLPAAFTRTLTPRFTPGSQLVGAVSFGDAYRRSPDLQFQYGVRIDGNRFLTTPSSNPSVLSAFGVRNDALPNRWYVSPRAGFSWTYGQASQLEIGEGFVRAPRAVVRGGVGVFRNTPLVQSIGPALTNTGLPDAGRQLFCVGAAVPSANWAAFAADGSTVPTRCADGSTGSVFASNAAPVTLFDADYAAQKSIRTNLNWTGGVLGDRLAANMDLTYSRNRNQPGVVDLNFNPAQRFALAGEGGRPVYVQPGSIVPATGTIATQDSRLDAGFRSVIEQRSDLASDNTQVSVSIAPVAFSSRFNWNLTYVYSSTRDDAYGFASTVGDPRSTDRARSAFDSRHQLVYSISYNFLDWVPVGLSGSFRSGRPYTPLVSGDVNGDGFNNDRAFVFDPGSATVDARLASQLRSLLAGGSESARDCLSRQLGRLSARNSCDGPWISSSNLTIALNPVKFRLPQRLGVAFYLNNAIGAADLLLHGEDARRGWGQAAVPDPTLLYVRGFDPVTRAFRYDANPRFGATSLAQTISRNPVVLTAQVRLDVGFTRERQLLTQSLDRGRGRPGTKSTDADIRGMGGALIPTNPMSRILARADSLHLGRLQADSIASLNRSYSIRFDAIWTPVARYLAALPREYDRSVAYERYREARVQSVDALIALVPLVRAVLTTEQLRQLPTFVTTSLDVRYLASVRSSTAGSANLGALGMLAQMGWAGGMVDASGGQQSIMIHR